MYKKTILTLIIFVVLLSVAILVAVFFHSMFFSMKNLPKGEYVDTFVAPDGKRQINTFLCNGGATVDFAMRCEVEDIV